MQATDGTIRTISLDDAQQEASRAIERAFGGVWLALVDARRSLGRDRFAELCRASGVTERELDLAKHAAFRLGMPLDSSGFGE
jgi:hypothetical protein